MTGRLFGERNYNNCNKWRRWGCNLHVKEWCDDNDPLLPDAAYGKLSSPMPSTRPACHYFVPADSTFSVRSCSNRKSGKQEAWFIFSSHRLFWLNAISIFRVPVDKSFYYTCKLEMRYTSDEANWKQWYSCPKGNSL